MRDTPRTAPIRAVSSLVAKVTGGPSAGCPWRSLYDPRVGAVLRAYDWRKSLREWWGDDPEWWLVEGLGIYREALTRVRADVVATKKRS